MNRPVFYNPNTAGGPDAWQDLVNKHQLWGVDLDWYTPTSQETYSPSGGPALQWKFVRQGRHTPAYWQRPPAYHLIPGTERVALYNNAKHQYLAYTAKECHWYLLWQCKPPLVYSTTPRFEWQVANGLLNADTYSVRAVELYNTTAGGYLINSHEDLGVDLDFQSGSFHLPNAYNPPPPPYPVSVSTFSR